MKWKFFQLILQVLMSKNSCQNLSVLKGIKIQLGVFLQNKNKEISCIEFEICILNILLIMNVV